MLRIKFNAILVGVLALLSLSSCDSSVGGLVGATGTPGEVMLVMDNQYFNAQVGDRLVQVLEAPAPALPQDEPQLRLSHVEHKGFESFLKLVRNVLIVNINADEYTEPKIKVAYDTWANGQQVVYLNSPSADALIEYLIKKESTLVNLILRHETYRYVQKLEESSSPKAQLLVDSIFGYTINVPKPISHYKVAKDFLWMSNGQMRKRQDLLVYTYPYNDVKDLEIDRMIAKRDSVLKANIVGEFEGSYPTTAELPTLYRVIKFPNGKMRSEMRGLWEMRGGAMMGGPFVSQSFLDMQNRRVLVVEGFVYNPNEDKLNLIRTMEASLYTFRPSDEKLDAKAVLDVYFGRNLWSE